MQNEITELRNQVRTLKRIVYGFGCLLVAGVVVSATSQNQFSNQTLKVQLVRPSYGVKIPITISDGITISEINKPLQIVNEKSAYTKKTFNISTN